MFRYDSSLKCQHIPKSHEELNLSPNAPMSFPKTPEEAEAAAKAYDAALDEFMGTYGRFMKSIVVSAMNAGNPKLYERIYTETREAFAK